jgi:zinc/manganese transport system substrate-binding protein
MRRLCMMTVTSVVMLVAPTTHADPLRVCATTPDLGSLVREVGGTDVTVTVFAKATEDPHFVEPRPSFVVDLRSADLLVVAGLDLEIGWLPPLLLTARNRTILAGGRGYLDASVAIDPDEVPTAAIDRSMGDVHPLGNPHYLTDPLNGLKVAALLRDKLTDLRPEAHEAFAKRYAEFRRRLGVAMVGDTLAGTYEFEKLTALYQYGRLDAFLTSQGQTSMLGGWLALMRPHRGLKAVEDHPVWGGFARRFGIDIIGRMEPLPGVPPTTRHLAEVVMLMRAEHVKLVLATAYYDPRHARFLAEQTGAGVAQMANEVGARPGTGDYLRMSNYNVRQVLAALKDSR